MKSRYRAGIKVYDSEKWQRLRRAYMESKHYICERCGRPAKICHHKEHLTESNVADPLVAFNPANLECLCQDCHNAEHEHFNKQGAIFNSKAEVVGINPTAETAEFAKARQAIATMEL